MLERDGRIFTTRIKTSVFASLTAPRSSTPYRIVRRCRAPGCALITILTDVTQTLLCGSLPVYDVVVLRYYYTCTTKHGKTWDCVPGTFLHKVHALHCMAVNFGEEGRAGGFDLRKTSSLARRDKQATTERRPLFINCHFFGGKKLKPELYTAVRILHTANTTLASMRETDLGYSAESNWTHSEKSPWPTSLVYME